MVLTGEQYNAVAALQKWYNKYSKQIIEVSGIAGTGIWHVISKFIEFMEFDPREIMYLSYNQKQVLEMAAKRYHTYYINSKIYNYTRVVDFNTLSVVNNNHVGPTEYTWVKSVKKKIDPRYKLMIVFDSVLLNHQTLSDLSLFGLPIILLRDPMLLPAPDSWTFLREPEIELTELNPTLLRNPITYFANKALRNESMKIGTYDNVSVINKKNLNLYNLKSTEMIITISETVSNEVNKIYREKIMKLNGINGINERVIVMNNMYNHKLINKDEKKIKLFLQKGLVAYISKCNKHAVGTRYVPIELKTDFYYDVFTDLTMDRHYLNGIENIPSRQIIPDELIKLKYAYSLPVEFTRVMHWDKVLLILDNPENDYYHRLIYNAIIRAKQNLTIVI